MLINLILGLEIGILDLLGPLVPIIGSALLGGVLMFVVYLSRSGQGRH